MQHNPHDFAVIGAGVFGAWIAHALRPFGSVVLLDGYGPANSRASSGAESRIIRMGYGPDELYTSWSMRSLRLWKEFFERIPQPLFQRTGVLWMAHEHDQYTLQTLDTLRKSGVSFEKLSPADLRKRYPQISFDNVAWGLLEPDSGVLMARQAVQALIAEERKHGLEFIRASVTAPGGTCCNEPATTEKVEAIAAGSFIFACGAWLPRLFPELLGDRIFPTRQEVFFFGTPAGSRDFTPPAMPAWIHLGDQVYALPDLESRGLKIAFDRHGPSFDPENGARVVTADGLRLVREYLVKRLPALADAPIVETRVCQYENTSNGDFLIDRHPDFDNVWIAGGGSGHGFKHGPAVGEYVAQRVTHAAEIDPRFALAGKRSVQLRAIF